LRLFFALVTKRPPSAFTHPLATPAVQLLNFRTFKLSNSIYSLSLHVKPKPRSIFYDLAFIDRRKLDTLFHEAHKKVFADFDCLSCGNCCKSIPPVVREADLRRISASLRMKPGDFQEKYLRWDEDGELVMNASPCPFLGPDNYCQIYKHRPVACAEYPHTDRVRMYQILKLTEKNASICPALEKILGLISLSPEMRVKPKPAY
jgi:Fe-S-cluster containining protein